jgi:hypothetical protein
MRARFYSDLLENGTDVIGVLHERCGCVAVGRASVSLALDEDHDRQEKVDYELSLLVSAFVWFAGGERSVLKKPNHKANEALLFVLARLFVSFSCDRCTWWLPLF